MTLLTRLIHDATWLSGGPTGGTEPAPRATLWLGPAVVRDDQLGALSRSPGPIGDLSVVNSGGAGGLLALARRATGLTVTAVESALRDLDDLAGNAARIGAAARDLPDDVVVFVQLPSSSRAPGWQRAVAAVEAEALSAKIDAAGGLAAAAPLLVACIEADLPFKVSGLPVTGLLPLVVAVAALIEGADPDDAVRAASDPASALAATVGAWDPTTQARVRRRLLGCDSPDPTATEHHLTALGLLPLPG